MERHYLNGVIARRWLNQQAARNARQHSRSAAKRLYVFCTQSASTACHGRPARNNGEVKDFLNYRTSVSFLHVVRYVMNIGVLPSPTSNPHFL